MRNVSDKIVGEIQNTLYDNFFPPENRGVYEITWKNIVDSGSPQMTIQYGAFASRAGYVRLQT